MENDNITDLQFISLFNSGSDEGIKALLKKYETTVEFYADKYSSYGLDREELVQEGYIAVWAAARVYNAELSQFSTFVSVCIQRSMVKLLRLSLRKGEIPQNMVSSLDDISVHSPSNPELSVIGEESFRGLFDSLKSTLTNLEFKVLFSYIYLGSYKETAEKLNLTEKVVSNSLSRARKKISQLTGYC